jgi:hypothetical protein
MEWLDRIQISRYYSASIYLKGQRETRALRVVSRLDLFVAVTFVIREGLLTGSFD